MFRSSNILKLDFLMIIKGILSIYFLFNIVYITLLSTIFYCSIFYSLTIRIIESVVSWRFSYKYINFSIMVFKILTLTVLLIDVLLGIHVAIANLIRVVWRWMLWISCHICVVCRLLLLIAWLLILLLLVFWRWSRVLLLYKWWRWIL